MTGRVLFYVQHLLGIGHLRRAVRLAAAASREGLAVTLVSGGEAVPELAAAGAAHIVQLAPVRALDAGFKNLVDAAGRPVDEALRAARRRALLDAFAAVRPDAVVIEGFPFGRRFFRFELDPLIAAARGRARLYSSIRDILVASPDSGRRREIVARVKDEFDRVFVHGDPSLVRLEDSFPEAGEIAGQLSYTGYVAASEPPEAAGEDAGIAEVLVSAGGGAVGGALLRAALAARRHGCLAGLRWRLLAGPNLPADEFAALAENLPEGVALERFRPDFPALLRHCRVSVSQAGYNTVVDILTAGAAAVLVPFAAARETEQSLRAQRLAARGVVETLAESQLSPQRLAQAIELAAARGPQPIAVDMNGAERTARLLSDMPGISSGRQGTL